MMVLRGGAFGCIYTIEYYSALKKEGDPVICNDMDGLQGAILNEVSQ